MGNDSVDKEHLDVYCSGSIVRLFDYKSLSFSGLSSNKFGHSVRDKGLSSEVDSFINSIHSESRLFLTGNFPIF